MTLPDYSEYLNKDGMLEYIEHEWLNNPAFHDIYSNAVNEVIKEFKIKTAIEIGCGTGNVAARLSPCKYIGVDANGDCITISQMKNPTKTFIHDDIRSYTATADLVFTFCVLKHFGLHEWDVIFNRIAVMGKYFVFDMPITDQVKDDGEEHHHVWGNTAWVEEKCKAAGFEIIKSYPTNKDEFCFVCKKVVK